jgi:hypothetical protein
VNDNPQLVRYQKADRQEVFSFLRTVCAPHDSDRLILQWDWKYDGNPFRPDAEPYILLLKDGGQIIGMEGVTRLRAVLAGKEHWVSLGGDLLLHPNYRGRGLAPRIVAQVQADNPLRFSWRNPLSHRSVGHQPGTSTRMFPLVKPLDFAYVTQRLTGRRWLGRCAAAVAESAPRLIRARRQQTAVPGVSVVQVDAFDQRFDALAQRASRDYGAMLLRDERYLSWRFINRPDVRYTVLAAQRASDVVGYMVLRSAADDAGVRWGYVVDFLVAERSPSLFSLLLEAAIACLRHDGVKAISCRTPPPYRRVLYRYGFLPWFWGPPSYFCVNFMLPDLRVFEDLRQWFVTMGDGDLETSF